MTRLTAHGIAVRKTILRLAATPDGFKLSDAGGNKMADNATRTMTKNGTLHKAKVKGLATRFFLQASMALAFEAANADRPSEKKSKFNRHPMPLAQPEPPALRAKALAQPKISKPVEIIYPDGYKKSSRMMVDRHAVTVPFVRFGTAAWAAPIGF